MSYWLLYSMTAMGRWQKREQKDNAGGGVDSTGLLSDSALFSKCNDTTLTVTNLTSHHSLYYHPYVFLIKSYAAS